MQLKSLSVLIGWWPYGDQLLNILNITLLYGHKKKQKPSRCGKLVARNGLTLRVEVLASA